MPSILCKERRTRFGYIKGPSVSQGLDTTLVPALISFVGTEFTDRCEAAERWQWTSGIFRNKGGSILVSVSFYCIMEVQELLCQDKGQRGDSFKHYGSGTCPSRGVQPIQEMIFDTDLNQKYTIAFLFKNFLTEHVSNEEERAHIDDVDSCGELIRNLPSH